MVSCWGSTKVEFDLNYMIYTHRNISRDSEIYKSPSSVIPERFLGDDPELDPYLFAFGFGRRLATLPVSFPDILC